MKVNLRKANQLALELQNKLKTVKVSPTTVVNLLTAPKPQVDAARKELLSKLEQKHSAIKALYAIRLAVGSLPRANQLLTRIAEQQALEAAVATFADNRYLCNVAELDAKFNRFVSATGDARHYAEESISVNLLLQHEIEAGAQTLKAIRKEILALKADLFDYNVSNFIELSDDTVKVLESFDLI